MTNNNNNESKKEKLVILGSGISGLTAAIYSARASLEPLVISGPQNGGQLTMTTEVENFPGFPEGVQGTALVEQSKKQAEKFGARFMVGVAKEFKKTEQGFEIMVDDKKIICEALIIATGASARWLGIPSEQKYKGKGVGTCATCDGFFYRGKEVLVIGGGDSAMEEATFLTKFAEKVTIIHRRDEFRASKIMQDKVFKNPKIKVIWNKAIEEVLGDQKGVTGAKLKDTVTGEITEIQCHGMFLALGHVPNTTIFKEILELDEKGYLKTDRFSKTNMPGVFGAGDVQDTRFRQAITAAGSGCMAAMEAEKYIEHQKK